MNKRRDKTPVLATGIGSPANQEVRALLDAAVDAIIVIDEQATIIDVGASAARMFGMRAGDMLGHNISMLMPEPYRSEHDGYMERYLRTGQARIIGIGREVQAQRADGCVFPCDLTVGEIHGTTPRRFVGFIRDISDRRDAEERARRAELEARQLQGRLTHFSRLSTMGEMASGLAHEVNQPLTAIVAYAQACLRILRAREGADADVVAALEQIDAQALRAGEVIRRLRHLVRNREVKREQIEPARLLEDLRTLAETDARAYDVSLRIECAEGLPSFEADPVQIQQVVLNLVRNAIDAIGGTGKQREIVLRAEVGADAESLEFRVEDHGPGLSNAALEQLFNPFFTTKIHGTGLGLAISRSIIRAHGGRLWHTPNAGGGARFHFTLPVATATQEDTR